MDQLQEKVQSLKELPVVKSQIADLKLRIESLEKIRKDLDQDKYQAMLDNYQKQLNVIEDRSKEIQIKIIVLKDEIELDSRMLSAENSVQEKELQEVHFLLGRSAINKQDHDSKARSLQTKIYNNTKLITKNQSCEKELDYYLNHVGLETYPKNIFNIPSGPINSQLSGIGYFFKELLAKVPFLHKPKFLVSAFIIIVLAIVGIKLLGSGNTVKIGNQIWSVKNLDVEKFRNGDPIPEAKTDEDWERAGDEKTPAWCYYDNESKNGKKYGKLYNWHAVNDLRGIAPEGWHVPTDAEWMLLVDYLGGLKFAGAKMKGSKWWKDNNNSNSNESSLTCLPGGARSEGDFRGSELIGCWWSSSDSEDYSKEATCFALSYDDKKVFRDGTKKSFGLSILCVKD